MAYMTLEQIDELMQSRRRSTPSHPDPISTQNFFPQFSPIRRGNLMIPADFQRASPDDSIVSIINISATSSDYNASTDPGNDADYESYTYRTPDSENNKRVRRRLFSSSDTSSGSTPIVHSRPKPSKLPRKLFAKHETFDCDTTIDSTDASSLFDDIPKHIPINGIQVFFTSLEDDVFEPGVKTPDTDFSLQAPFVRQRKRVNGTSSFHSQDYTFAPLASSSSSTSGPSNGFVYGVHTPYSPEHDMDTDPNDTWQTTPSSYTDENRYYE